MKMSNQLSTHLKFVLILATLMFAAAGCKSACEEYQAKACESKNKSLCKEAKMKISKWGADNFEKCKKGIIQVEAIMAFEKEDGGMKSSTPVLDDLPGLEDGAKMLDADPKNLDKLPK